MHRAVERRRTHTINVLIARLKSHLNVRSRAPGLAGGRVWGHG